MELVRRILAILRRAELGFLGVVVLTLRHTPRFCGESWSIMTRFLELYPFSRAGALAFFSTVSLPLRTDVYSHSSIVTFEFIS